MQYLIIGVLLLVAMIGLIQIVARANPRTLTRIARYLIAGALIAAGVGLTAMRQFMFGLPLLAFGVGALVRGRIGGFDLGGGSRSIGGASTVSARYVEASLDHDSGALTGAVMAGRHSGRSLDDLDATELDELRTEAAGDPDSVALVEAYLDRRFPGWREDREQDAGPRPGGATDSGTMTDQEAYEILGLAAGADEAEIRAAHRRLLKGVHPDQGGSTFLAARINQAKDRLLGRHRMDS